MKPIDLFVIQKVIEKREARDMTQEALSIALNYSMSYINKFEKGKKKFNISHLNEIAKIRYLGNHKMINHLKVLVLLFGI